LTRRAITGLELHLSGAGRLRGGKECGQSTATRAATRPRRTTTGFQSRAM